MNVKFHSSQDKTSQSIATNVFRNTKQKAEEAQDLVEEAQVAEEALVAEEAQVAEDLAAVEALTEDREKCTKRLVETVARNAKFHSSQKETSQSIAANVFKVIEETRIIPSIMDKTNPIRMYYVVPIVIIILSILVFLDFK